MPRQLRVFLCHASQDKPAVWNMYRYLKGRGISPWLDQTDLLPGQDWEVEIPKAIFTSDIILVCLSKNSVNKGGFVQKEITFALDKAQEKPQGTIFIIPVKLEECDVPQRLSRYQWVDYFRPDGRKRLLTSLDVQIRSLGENVSPVNLEDTHKSNPASRLVGPNQGKRKDSKDAISQKPRREEPKYKVTEKAVREKVKRKSPFAVVENKKEQTRKSTQKFDSRLLGLGRIIILIGLFLGGIYAFATSSIAQGVIPPTATLPTRAPTIVPSTATRTPIPSTLTPTPTIGSMYISDGMTMMYVPKGSFSMGSIYNENEAPIHAVFVDSFYMDKYEVTNAAFKRCVEANVCDPPKPSSSNIRYAYYSNPEFDEFPAIYVNWDMAKSYCEWRDARLPTEAEWEKVARGADGRTYPWGEGISCDKANIVYNNTYCMQDTTQVGIYTDGASPYSVYDMAGNVWEWVNDWYGLDYYQNSPSSNPEGPSSGTYKVVRGGSFGDSFDSVRSSVRSYVDPVTVTNAIGFRCARSP